VIEPRLILIDESSRPEQRKLELIIGDFVKADLPYFDVCISNTPYQVSRIPVMKMKES